MTYENHINKFVDAAAIQAAIDNGDLLKPYVALNESAGTIDYNTRSDTPDYSNMYLTIEALEDGVLKIRRGTTYSVNDGEWLTVVGPLYESLSLNTSDKVRVKGSTGMTFYESTVNMKAYGNIMSVAYGDDFIGKTEIPSNFGGWNNMFDACSGLIDVSGLVLPPTTLTNECYQSMFYDCTSLTKAPSLPATTLVRYCYKELFRGCTSLNYIKCLATNPGEIDGTFRWLLGVSPTGTFVKKAGVTWPTGDTGIPSGWTVIEE